MALCALMAAAWPAWALDVQGHRGARGLAPENTLAGFRAALAAGATTWELDVGLTRDGHLVVIHDRRLNADMTRDAEGRWIDRPTPTVASLDLKVLQGYDVGRARPGTRHAANWPAQQPVDGERIPTLEAVFELARREAPASLRFNIETKLSPLAPDETAAPEVFARSLLALIDRHGLRGRVTVQSFDWRTLALLHRLAPDLAIAALSVQRPDLDNISSGAWTAGLTLAAHDGSVPKMVKALGASVWSPDFRSLTPQRLAEARTQGLKVIPWTVNEPEDIERLIQWGVDGIISDYPDRVAQRVGGSRSGQPDPREPRR